ncbi:iron complex outermembrane receptor protein [Sphingobium sp. OAS761]|uniref:TonB-dependent receptor n=1 Tax=Sphingobium sp. OAS761 TaxID=2817901 RepID=UPI00209DCE9B|nr:TonB-dependent receptor [Sphingobium sp. OAS761]MCP1470347.1 iron complex outermembrane receptor protein [Sphingobium sp. OAS761]
MSVSSASLKSGTIIAMACVAMPAAYAQNVKLAEQNTDPNEIIVSARRVDESLQQVPVAVSAVSSAMLKDLNVRTPDQLNAVVPNVAMVQVGGSPIGNVAYIRGIGTGDPNAALDPPVATYIDGVYIGRMTAANLELADVQRIEVLRGPQGTLFGRNTTGGAISLVTRVPDPEFGFEQRVTIGERGEFISRSRVTTGDLGQSGLRATAVYLHRQRHGTLNSPTLPSDRDPGALSLDAFWTRIHGEWGSVTADYTFDLMNGDFMSNAYQIMVASDRFKNYFGRSESLGGAPLVMGADGRIKNLPVLESDPIDVRSLGHALTLNADLSDALSVKSISAYRKFHKLGVAPYGPDGLRGSTPTGVQDMLVYASRPNQYQHQFSQEVQLYGTSGDLSYIGGLYYFREKAREEGISRGTFLISDTLAAPFTSLTNFSVKSVAKAAFGQLTYRPSWADERLEMAGGLRYSHDRKVFQQTASTVRGGTASFDNVSYNFTASYRITPDVMLFGRVGTGYRAGGFNTRASAGADFTFKPEKANVYEIGIKSDFLDKAVRFNVTGFYTKYRDLQVNQFNGVTKDGTVGDILSAAAVYKGIETELTIRPVRGLTLYSNVGYTDARYDRIFFPNPATGFLENYADQAYFAYQPKWTVANGISYSQPLASVGTFQVRLDHSYTSRRYFAASPAAIAPWTPLISDPSHNVFNARVSLSDIPLTDRVKGDVALWGQNIFSEEYINNAIDFGSLGFAGGVYSEPARFGVDFTVRF